MQLTVTVPPPLPQKKVRGVIFRMDMGTTDSAYAGMNAYGGHMSI